MSGEGVYVVPAVEGPEPGVQSHGPVADVMRGVVEPALLLPVLVRVAAVGEPGYGDYDADDKDTEERDKLQKHEDVSTSCA